MRTLLPMVMAVGVCACAREEAPAPQPTKLWTPKAGGVPALERPENQKAIRAELPVRVRWQQEALTPNSAVVRAEVERVLGMAMPFTVTIELPPGVTASRGRTSFTLSPNAEASVIAEELELTFQTVPTEDAVLKVDGETGVMGYHFKVPYRFGRPEPVVEAPKATGPRLRMGERDFGPSIPLK